LDFEKLVQVNIDLHVNNKRIPLQGTIEQMGTAGLTWTPSERRAQHARARLLRLAHARDDRGIPLIDEAVEGDDHGSKAWTESGI
jgi:hypothetical protein